MVFIAIFKNEEADVNCGYEKPGTTLRDRLLHKHLRFHSLSIIANEVYKIISHSILMSLVTKFKLLRKLAEC